MSGHAGDVEPTEEQIGTALRAMMIQLKATGLGDRADGSVSQALEDLNLNEFIYNQAKVIASLHAFSVRDNAIIHKLTMAGAYVKLDLPENS